MPVLNIQLPGLPPVSHVLKDQTVTIGRMKGNTIVIEDSSISLMHAKITGKQGDFLLKDLNSTNGTSVNGQPIGEVVLRDQDRVHFAEISCQFLADAPLQTEQVAPIVPSPATASAPIRATPAPPAIATSSTAVPAAKSSPGRPPKRTFPPALRYAGSVLAVVVVSLVGWRFFELNRAGNTQTAAFPEEPKALLEAKARTDTPRQDKDASGTRSQLRNAISQAPDSEPPKSKAEAERAAESTKEAIPQLAQALKSENVAERRKAAAALHSLGAEAKEAIPALREALNDDDSDVQMWAALALVNNQEFDKNVVPVLVRVLQNDNPVLRQVACLSLGLIPYRDSEKETIIPPLSATANKDANEDVRKAALSALRIIAPETVGKTASK